MATTNEFPPPTGGMVRSVAPHQLAPNECEFLVDALLHIPGELRQRGPLTSTNAGGTTSLPLSTGTRDEFKYPSAFAVHLNGKFLRKAQGRNPVLSTSIASTFVTGSSTEGGPSTDTSWVYVTERVADSGAVLVTQIPRTITTTNTGLIRTYVWYGSTTPETMMGGLISSTALTLTGTAAVDATGLVTGVGTSFTTNTQVSVGSIILNSSNRFVGIVESITSATVMQLTDTPYTGTIAAGSTIKCLSLHTFTPRYQSGSVTSRTTQSTIIGTNTDFSPLGVMPPVIFSDGAVNLFSRAPGDRRSTLFGYTSFRQGTDNPLSIESRTASGSAVVGNALAVNDNNYWFGYYNAMPQRANGGFPENAEFLGFYQQHMTMYQGRLFACRTSAGNSTLRNRLSFSGLQSIFDFNVGPNGDWIGIKSNLVYRILGASNGLVIFTDKGVQVVNGNDPSNFTYRDLHDDSCIGSNAVCRVGDSVAWIGSKGIYITNGETVELVTQRSFGATFSDLLSAKAGTTAVLRYSTGYLLANFNDALKDINYPASYGGASTGTFVGSNTLDAPCLAVYLPTKAACWWSNFNMLDLYDVDGVDYLWMTGYSTGAAGVTVSIPFDTVLNGFGNDTIQSITQYGRYIDSLAAASPTSANGNIDDYTSTAAVQATAKSGLGRMNAAEYTSTRTALDIDGTAWEGSTPSYAWSSTYVKQFQPTDQGGGNYRVAAAFDVSGLPESPDGWLSCFFFNIGIYTQAFIRGRTSNSDGWRITSTGGLRECSFASDTSWSHTDGTVLTAPGLGTAHQFFQHPAGVTPAFRFETANPSNFITWEVMPLDVTTVGPNPFVLTRAFGGGVKLWLRKLRLFYRSGTVVGVRAISNMDHDYEGSTAWGSGYATATSTSAVDDPVANVNNTYDVRFGRTMETVQFAVAPMYAKTGIFRLFQMQPIFKTLRRGR